jgi:transposase
MANARRGRRGKSPEAAPDWLDRMLERKPVKLVAIALANRMARTIWALIKRGDIYRAALA